MARPQKSDSVATVVGLLMVNNQVAIQGKKIESVAVMVSNLKKKEEHKDKKFKLKQENDIITVKRVA